MAANLPQSYVKRPLFPCYDLFSWVTIGHGGTANTGKKYLSKYCTSTSTSTPFLHRFLYQHLNINYKKSFGTHCYQPFLTITIALKVFFIQVRNASFKITIEQESAVLKELVIEMRKSNEELARQIEELKKGKVSKEEFEAKQREVMLKSAFSLCASAHWEM